MGGGTISRWPSSSRLQWLSRPATGIAVAALGWRWHKGGRSVAAALEWRGRSAVVGVLVFGAFLMRSDLNAGFRYALPAVVLLSVVAAVGVADLRRGWTRFARLTIPTLVVLQAVSVLTVYPHFLAYSSVWAGGRDNAHRALVDSNLDWGQGLLELRAFMEEEGVQSVWLSYFGSVPPEAYGIEYVALPSFFSLAHGPNIRCGGVPALHRSFGDESARDVICRGGTRLQR